nr:putative ribonuclease H-like domain-containing protein [Tanacetum cinerariifolium]
VIVNGDSVSSVASASSEGPIPPKTAEQKLAKKNKLKAKSTLMLAIPNEHLLKFHACKDAKSLWEEIKNRFGGNKESKKMQKTILKQNYINFATSSQEGLDKTYDSLPSAWNNIALIMRNKSDLDTLSINDLYNNLKVYESEIKSQSSSRSNSHNVAFVSSNNTSSTNETANTTHGVSAASSKDQASTASYADDIDTDDLEEIDLKWQVAMLTIRVKRFIKKTGTKLYLNVKDIVGFDRTKVECYNCHRRDHFSRECKAPRSQGNRNKDAPTRNAPVDTSTINALLAQDGICAFVSSDNTSSTNEIVNTAHGVSGASSNDQASTASYDDDVMFSFFSNQSNTLQLDNEDLEQIDTDDLEEMDLKWIKIECYNCYSERSRLTKEVNQWNQTKGNAGTKANIDAGQAGKNTVHEKYVRNQEKAPRKQFEQESERFFGQGEAANTNNTNRLNNVSLPVNTVSSSFTTVDPRREIAQRNELKKADYNNLELTTVVSPIPKTRIHKDHPKKQIIGDPLSALQTRRMTRTSQEHAIVTYIKKQRRTNHNDYQNCLLACFLSQIEPKKVWRLVDLPKVKHATGTKWIYRNKKDERGIVVRNKATLVAQGYTQEEDIDYDKVFAPVARIKAIMSFLAYVPFMGFIVYQMDVKSAFLYGTIEDEVYMCQPLGFEDPHFYNKVYKVEKVLYGLHQAPKAWYETLSTYLLENGFRRWIINKTMFIKKDKGDILLVYVDDIIFRSNKKSLCTEFEGLMHKKFQMSSVGELTFFLGLQVM